MTLMTFLLLIILFLVFFIYFSGLNPQEVAVFFLPDHQLTTSVALLVIGCILLGLVVGYLVHLYGAASYLVKNWRRNRSSKRAQEVAALHREGLGLFLSGDVKKARRLLQKAIGLDGARIEVLLTMADLAQAEGESAEALSLLQRARKLAPQDLAVLFRLGEICQKSGQGEEAVAAFQEVLAEDAESLNAMAALRDLFVARSCWRDALEMQKRLVKKTADERQAGEKETLYGLRYETACLLRQEGEEEKALAEFQALAKEAPAFLPARVAQGDVSLALGRSEQAAQIWQEGYGASGRSIFLSRLEDLAMAEEDPTGLLNFYRSQVDRKPDDLKLRLFYGKFCLRLEMVDEALEQFSEVEKSGADFPWLHLLLAETHVRRQRLPEAVEEYRQALGGNGRFRPGYVCQKCGEGETNWQGRCSHCGAWGALQLAGYQLIKGAPASELREIHHGERQE
jgi:lipopolysaccharide biosynthesis regulator YciM